MAAIAGDWNDPLANAPHLAWFAASATLLYFAVRRFLPRHWAVLAAYGYLSLPLATMHGTNPYADVFVSAHVFLAASWTLAALKERDAARSRAWFLLTGVALGALSFTKNEGVIVYAPPLVLVLCVALALRWKSGAAGLRSVSGSLARLAAPFLLVALPWLAFKWAHGLTFGNAKPVSDFTFHWRDNVLLSVAVNTFLEGNWLLLFPLAFVLPLWRRRAAWRTYLPLTAFVCIVYFGQLAIFLFTDLAVEALMQTGYARGIIQLMPCIVLLTALLLADAAGERNEEAQ
jgi:4-amino-4-deoxy-L-arabinose transferase-like glycosyltransferase